MPIRDILVDKVLPGLAVAAIGWVAAPFVKAKMEGTPLNGMRGILSFWSRNKRQSSDKPRLSIVVLSTPQPRWHIGAMADIPYVSFSFHARLAHKEKVSLEIVQGHLQGTKCFAPFLPIMVSGPYDPSVMVHVGVRPILTKEGQVITRRVVLVDQFGNTHTTDPITFQPGKQPSQRFGSGAATLNCHFCGKPIEMMDLSETAAIPAHKRCVR